MTGGPQPGELGFVVEAQAGDRSAFAQLVHLHQERIRSFLARYVYDAEAIEDLTQEAFVAAHAQLTDFDSGRDFGAWLRGIARNQALLHLRSQRRRRHHERHAAEAYLQQQRLDELAVRDDDGRAALELEQLRHCLGNLRRQSGDDHRLLEERYFRQRSDEAVAAEEGIGRGALRTRLLRLRKALRACIEKRLLKQGLGGG